MEHDKPANPDELEELSLPERADHDISPERKCKRDLLCHDKPHGGWLEPDRDSCGCRDRHGSGRGGRRGGTTGKHPESRGRVYQKRHGQYLYLPRRLREQPHPFCGLCISGHPKSLESAEKQCITYTDGIQSLWKRVGL